MKVATCTTVTQIRCKKLTLMKNEFWAHVMQNTVCCFVAIYRTVPVSYGILVNWCSYGNCNVPMVLSQHWPSTS